MDLIVAAAGAAGRIDAGGLTGWVLDVVRTIGEPGIALLVLLEVVVPPIPSEVVLPFSGALVADRRFTFLGVLLAATVGSVLGAQLLHELARRLGRDRVTRWLAAVPLVRRDDVERGADWFDRHGRTAVLTGRMVPGVRSMISIPVGGSPAWARADMHADRFGLTHHRRTTAETPPGRLPCDAAASSCPPSWSS